MSYWRPLILGTSWKLHSSTHTHTHNIWLARNHLHDCQFANIKSCFWNSICCRHNGVPASQRKWRMAHRNGMHCNGQKLGRDEQQGGGGHMEYLYIFEKWMDSMTWVPRRSPRCNTGNATVIANYNNVFGCSHDHQDTCMSCGGERISFLEYILLRSQITGSLCERISPIFVSQTCKYHITAIVQNQSQRQSRRERERYINFKLQNDLHGRVRWKWKTFLVSTKRILVWCGSRWLYDIKAGTRNDFQTVHKNIF